MNKIELSQEILPAVKEVAIKAGKKLLMYSKKLEKLKVSSKLAEGMVSEADIETEKLIEKGLKKILREADFLGEESVYLKIKDKEKAFKEFEKKQWCWIVDPLDGTHNFLSGLDYYGVCIALAYYGEPVLGVVYKPESGEIYFAVKNKGAYKEETGKSKKISLKKSTNSKKLKEAMVVTGFANEKGINDTKEFKRFKTMMDNCRGVRRFGSAALDMCNVAEGKFDSFWEKGLGPWDVAASGIICQEANVLVTDFNGNEFHPFQKSILCARKPFYQKFLKLI